MLYFLLLQEVIKIKVKEAYLSQIRKKAITKLLLFNRTFGNSPTERILIDTNLLLRIFAVTKKKNLIEKSKCVISDIFAKIIFFYRLEEKVERVKTQG